MKGETVIYKGRIIDKKIFRAFIYGANGEKKLVESWDQFQSHMQSGIWFASVEDAKSIKGIIENSEPVKSNLKPKSNSKPKTKQKDKVEEIDGMVIEVKDENR